jgi:anti-anti-sigma factor
MSGLKINVDESHTEVVRIDLDGYLDAHTFESLEHQLESLFRQEKYRIMVDLHKLRYISSAGAGVFIGSLGTCQDHDGNIALVRPSPEVKEIFDLLGVFHIFPIADTPEEAMTVLAG